MKLLSIINYKYKNWIQIAIHLGINQILNKPF